MGEANQKQHVSFWFKALLTFIVFFSILSLTIVIPALPKLAKYFAIHKDTAQQISSMIFFGSAVSGLIYGPLSDSFGRKPVLVFSLGLYTLFALLSSFAKDVEMFMFLQFLLGINVGTGSVLTLAITKDYLQGSEAAKLIASMGAVAPIAPAVGPLVGGYLEAFWGWTSIYIFISAMALILFIVTFFCLPETHHRHKRMEFSLATMGTNFFTVLKEPSFLKYAFIMFFMFGGFQVYNVTAAFIFINQMNIPSQTFAYFLLFSSMGVVGGNILVHFTVMRHGVKKLIKYCGIFSIISAIAFFCVTAMDISTPWAYTVCMFVYASGMGVAFSTAVPLGMETALHAKGYTSSLLRLFQMAGAAVSTSIVAEFYNQTFWPTAILLLTFSILLLILSKNSRFE